MPHKVTEPVPVYSNIVTASWTKETFKMGVETRQKKTVLAEPGFTKEVDVSWLPAASEVYKISPDIKDYIAVQIPIVTVDIPNRNLQAFPFEEISRFDHTLGKLVYQTFHAKPCHINHVNENPEEAKGVHADVNMDYVPKWDVWKINVLTLWDRTKDMDLVKSILAGKKPFYSMGAWVDVFVCSVCGNTEDSCSHMANKGGIFNGTLAYQMCVGCNYFETSNVESPADPEAVSNMILY